MGKNKNYILKFLIIGIFILMFGIGSITPAKAVAENGEMPLTGNESVPKFVDISGGYYHFLALTDDGKVWGWGNNLNGGVGDGTTVNRVTPAEIQGLDHVKSISAGYNFLTAIKEDGRSGAGEVQDSVMLRHSVPTIPIILSLFKFRELPRPKLLLTGQTILLFLKVTVRFGAGDLTTSVNWVMAAKAPHMRQSLCR